MYTHLQDFEKDLRAQGYDEVHEVHWAPFAEVEPHQHPFAAKAVVIRGEMWLTIGTHTRHLGRGGAFELGPGELHSERYGSEGATYWVARRGPQG
jgi:quercetin dioxygenase-like cupin family protein